MSEQQKPVGHINLIGPFQTFRDYNAKVERCKQNPRRLECRHRPVEHKDGNSRVTRLAAYSRASVFA